MTLQERTERARKQVYEKMSAEFDIFLNKFEYLTGEDAIALCYEKVIKEDLLLCVENDEIELEVAETLLALDTPLDDAYNSWLECDFSYMDILHDSFNDFKSEVYKKQKNKKSKDGKK